jgi:hypothetical protein
VVGEAGVGGIDAVGVVDDGFALGKKPGDGEGHGDAVISVRVDLRALERLPAVDAIGLEARAATLATRSIKTESKRAALDTIIRLIDLTTLEGADTPGKVKSLVAKALVPDSSDPTTPRVAAVCV